jgi:hypothetical protein
VRFATDKQKNKQANSVAFSPQANNTKQAVTAVNNNATQGKNFLCTLARICLFMWIEQESELNADLARKMFHIRF